MELESRRKSETSLGVFPCVATRKGSNDKRSLIEGVYVEPGEKYHIFVAGRTG